MADLRSVTEADLPSVSVLMPAYNYAAYIGRAISSALEQDYPPDRLRLVVVDDGSIDATAAVVSELAERHPGRIELIRQENAGPSAAINRALAAADGDLIAVLDADDVWLPMKTRRQAEALRADPALGLVFCDMTVVDGDERAVRPSQVGAIGEFPRRAFARLLFQNVATQSSIMLRRELARPVPREIPYSDWWFAVCAASVADVLYMPEQLALYREHGANLTSGVSGSAGVREHRKEIAFQLWALQNLEIGSLSADECELVWRGVEEHARRVLAAAGSFFATLVAAEVLNRTESARHAQLAQRASASGDHAEACRLLLRALAFDPYDPDTASAFRAAAAQARTASREPDPLAGARRHVVVAAAEELLEDDQMLSAYAAAMAGVAEVTLAVDATGLDERAAAEALQSLVGRCGLDDRDDIDLLAVLGPLGAGQRERILTRAIARYRRGPGSEEDAAIPEFTLTSLGDLRELVSGPGSDRDRGGGGPR